MQKYELGGVKFIVHDGEVYCRYLDVFEEENLDAPPIVYNTTAPKPTVELKLDTKTARAPRSCKVCGKAGHIAKTCPQAGATAYSLAVDRSQNEPEKSLSEVVRDLVKEGCSLDEILLTAPLEPEWKIRKLFEEHGGKKTLQESEDAL